MCDRAGIEALWLSDRPSTDAAGVGLEAWAAAVLVSQETQRARIGVRCLEAARPVQLLIRSALTLDAISGDRLELGLSGGLDLDGYATSARSALERPPISIEVTGKAGIALAARLADDMVIPASSIREMGDVSAAIRDACRDADRKPDTLGVAIEVPVSIGRTTAEAHARVEADPAFDRIGHPAITGIFGTLEGCQDRVIELAHAGVTDLRCVVPNTPDVSDVIAQITAMAIGSVDVLAPGSPRSPSPEPPEGWGGRTLRS